MSKIQEKKKKNHLNTVERGHTHVEEHAVEHRHGDELADTEHNGINSLQEYRGKLHYW